MSATTDCFVAFGKNLIISSEALNGEIVDM